MKGIVWQVAPAGDTFSISEHMPARIAIGGIEDPAERQMHPYVLMNVSGRKKYHTVRSVIEAVEEQNETPEVALFGKTIQIVFTVCPVPKTWGVFANLKSFSLSCYADADLTSKSGVIFSRLYAEKRYIHLRILGPTKTKKSYAEFLVVRELRREAILPIPKRRT